jgi:rhodanese-related sulfurtransferase
MLHLEVIMRYALKQIHCRPWLLNGLSLKLMESHYENNYGGALRRLNAITEQLASLDFEKAPGYVLNGLKREELVALNSIVEGRYGDAGKVLPPRPLVQAEYGDLPSIGVEEVSSRLSSGESLQVIDVRPRHCLSRQQDIAEGIRWRDPERVQDWIGELSKSEPVVVYCAYGFHVGCNTAVKLREAGFDAKYMNSGHSGWKAIGAPVRLATENSAE